MKQSYKYDDNLSSINIHFAKKGKSLVGILTTHHLQLLLLIQKPEAGGEFEYIREFRNSKNNDNNYDRVS